MSAKRVRLQRRTSGRPIPIEIEALAAARGGQPHPFEARVAAAVGGEDRRAGRDVLDVGDEASRADDPPAVQIFHSERSGDLVVPRWDVQCFVLPDVGGAVRRIGRTKAMIERGLQRSGVVGREIADCAEAAVLYADGIIVGK
jgi:hypothetical protein